MNLPITTAPLTINSVKQFKDCYPKFYHSLLQKAEQRIKDPRMVLLADIDAEIVTQICNLGQEVHIINYSYDLLTKSNLTIRGFSQDHPQLDRMQKTIPDLNRLINVVKAKIDKRFKIAQRRYSIVSSKAATIKAQEEVDSVLELIFSGGSKSDYDRMVTSLDSKISKYEKSCLFNIARAFFSQRSNTIESMFDSWYDGDYNLRMALEPIVSFVKNKNETQKEQGQQKQTYENAKTIGKVTINSYDCQVLNADRVMFIDIDLPVLREQGSDIIYHSDNSGHSSSSYTHIKTEEEALENLNEFCSKNPELTFLSYRTAGGLRLVETSQTHDPTSEQTQDIMTALGADPLYKAMCKEQNCFRARITPKPWRMWAYDGDLSEVAVCEIAGKGFYGASDSRIHPEVEAVLEVHDRNGVVNSDGSKVLA